MKSIFAIVLLIVALDSSVYSEQNDSKDSNEKVSEIEVKKDLNLDNLSLETKDQTYKTSALFDSELKSEKPKSFTEKIKEKIENKLSFFEFKDD